MIEGSMARISSTLEKPGMGVDMAVYLVNWADFQSKVLRAEAYEVVEEIQHEPITYTNASAPMDFMDAFDSFKRAWKSDEKLYFKEVFDTLFYTWRDNSNRIMELVQGEDQDSDLFGIETAMKPETVADFVEQASRFNLEDCRQLYEKYVRDNHRFGPFEEWKSYGEEWISLLKRASRENKGLIIMVFG